MQHDLHDILQYNNVLYLPCSSLPARISLPSCKQQCFAVFTRARPRQGLRHSGAPLLRCSGGRVESTGRVLVLLVLLLIVRGILVREVCLRAS